MKKKREMEVWYGRFEDARKHPDLAYWQAQPDEKKFAAAWEMVIEAYAVKGIDIRETRLNKNIGGLRPIKR